MKQISISNKSRLLLQRKTSRKNSYGSTTSCGKQIILSIFVLGIFVISCSNFGLLVKYNQAVSIESTLHSSEPCMDSSLPLMFSNGQASSTIGSIPKIKELIQKLDNQDLQHLNDYISERILTNTPKNNDTNDATRTQSVDEIYKVEFVKDPFQQMEDFLQSFPDTPGARLIHSLRKYMHYAPHAEYQRLHSCDKKAPKTAARCYTGKMTSSTTVTTAITTTTTTTNHYDSKKPKDFIPLTNITADELPRYYGGDHFEREQFIPTLGTTHVCLPLILAGAAVNPKHVTVELGPYLGFSSKCIAAGLASTGLREGDFYIFDIFEGEQNLKRVKEDGPWITKKYPFYNEANTSFLFLWEKAVRPVYPIAKGIPGWIDKTTLNQQVIGSTTTTSGGGTTNTNTNTVVDLISIDSAKSAKQLHTQLEGIGVIKAGTILGLLDFEYVHTQVKLVYGCMRHEYILPVYTGFAEMETWIFVVLKDFTFANVQFQQCAQEIQKNREMYETEIFQTIDQDLLLLSGLQNDRLLIQSMKTFHDHMREHLQASITTKNWNRVI